MAMVFADRVKETTTTTGTGTLDLGGAATGFQSFVAGIGTTNECSYCITDDTDWEVGEGTVTDASPDTLSRDTILASSNSDAAVNWSSGTKTVFVVYPAGVVAVTSYTNSTNNRIITSVDSTTVNGEANLTFDGSVLAATGNITATGTVEPAGDTAAGDNAAIGYTSVEGLILTGQGSTNDVTIKNDADAAVISIPTGTTNVTIAGDLTVSGDDITMATNTSGAALIADGTNFNPVVISGDISINTSGVAAIGSGVIVEADIADNAVTLAKMAGGTDGNIISYDASGDPVAVATGTDGQVLTSAGAGAPPAFEDAGGGGSAGLNFIGTDEFSGVTSVTVTGLSSTYDTYLVTVTDLEVAVNQRNIHFQIGNSGGVIAAKPYGFVDFQTNSLSTSTTIEKNGDADHTLVIEDMGNHGNGGGGLSLWLYGPGDKSSYPMWSGSFVNSNRNVIEGEVFGSCNAGTFGAIHSAVIDVDRVHFYSGGGNFSGRVTVWGLAHA